MTMMSADIAGAPFPFPNNAPLPPGWHPAVDEEGYVYFVHPETEDTTWTDPRWRLPEDHEERRGDDGEALFVELVRVVGNRSAENRVKEKLLKSDPRGALADVIFSHSAQPIDTGRFAPKRCPETGCVYYVDHESQSTVWEDPRYPLPHGWREAKDDAGVSVFTASVGASPEATYRDPRVLAAIGALPAGKAGDLRAVIASMEGDFGDFLRERAELALGPGAPYPGMQVTRPAVNAEKEETAVGHATESRNANNSGKNAYANRDGGRGDGGGSAGHVGDGAPSAPAGGGGGVGVGGGSDVADEEDADDGAAGNDIYADDDPYADGESYADADADADALAGDLARMDIYRRDGSRLLRREDVAVHKGVDWRTRYEKVRKIAEGGFGNVLLAKVRDGPRAGESVVVKVLNVRGDRDKRATAMREVYVHGRCSSHGNVVEFREAFVGTSTIAIVMEYCEGGTLHDLIASRDPKLGGGGHMPEAHIMFWFACALDAIGFMHRHGVVHRDIKPANCLLNRNTTLVVADFGFAAHLERCRRDSSRGDFHFTPEFVSPEVLSGQPHTLEGDMWSLGVLLYSLAALKLPFTVTNPVRQMALLRKKITTEKPPPLPKQYSSDLRRIVSSLLRKKAKFRPSISQLMEDPYIAEYLEKARERREIEDHERVCGTSLLE